MRRIIHQATPQCLNYIAQDSELPLAVLCAHTFKFLNIPARSCSKMTGHDRFVIIAFVINGRRTKAAIHAMPLQLGLVRMMGSTQGLE